MATNEGMPPTQPTPPPPPAPAQSAPAAPSAASNMLAAFTRAELFAAAGALLIVAGDLVFGLLTRDYSVGDLPWAVATVTLLAVVGLRLARISLPIAHETIIVMAGITMAFVGARDLLYDLRSLSGGNVAATFFLGMVVYYAGVALMAAGAWMLWRRRTA